MVDLRRRKEDLPFPWISKAHVTAWPFEVENRDKL